MNKATLVEALALGFCMALAVGVAPKPVRADLMIVNSTAVPLDVEIRIDDASTSCHGARIGNDLQGPNGRISVDFSASPDRVNFFWYTIPPGGFKIVWCGNATGRRIFAAAKKPDGTSLPDQTFAQNFDDPAWKENYYRVPYASSESISSKPAPGGHGVCSKSLDIYCRTNQCAAMLHYSGVANSRDVSIQFQDCTYIPLHSPHWFGDDPNAACQPMAKWETIISLIKASLPPGSTIDFCPR